MEDSKQDLQELIVLKSKLETALEKDDKEEIRKTYDEFRSLYKKLTGKEFEAGLDPERLAQIEAVINGSVKTDKIIDDTENVIEI